MENKGLVSVVIITYNSASTIVEVLDSIKKQSYDSVEIVVSDDCSTDNSVEVCELWSKANSEQQMVIVRSDKNSGLSGNLNRGVKAAKGEWIKIMAADDLLFDYSIAEFVNFVHKNSCEMCICRLYMFGDNTQNINIKKKFYNQFYNKYNGLDQKQHYKLILSECLLPGPGMFISKRLLEEIGLFDERYPFAEEWPTYLSILKRGYDILYFEQELVKYRCTGNTLGSDNNNRLSLRVFKDTIKSFKEVRRPLMLENKMYLKAWMETLNLKVSLIKYNDKLSIKDKLQILALLVVNPQSYSKAVKFIFNKP